ncbi:MAG: hypothetical protein OQK82_03955 [Candidatus Pacearchaeota archaeon]|nr:hypothetical protein [Candidatus Pacearchaeota archaeon]
MEIDISNEGLSKTLEGLSLKEFMKILKVIDCELNNRVTVFIEALPYELRNNKFDAIKELIRTGSAYLWLCGLSEDNASKIVERLLESWKDFGVESKGTFDHTSGKELKGFYALLTIKNE